MRRSYARATLLLEQAEATGVSFTDRITNLVRAHITAEIDDRVTWRLNHSELANLSPVARTELMALGDEFEHVWRRVISEGISEGVFVPEDASIARLSIIQMCKGVAVGTARMGQLSLDDITAIVARQTLAVLNVRSSYTAFGECIWASARCWVF